MKRRARPRKNRNRKRPRSPNHRSDGANLGKRKLRPGSPEWIERTIAEAEDGAFLDELHDEEE